MLLDGLLDAARQARHGRARRDRRRPHHPDHRRQGRGRHPGRLPGGQALPAAPGSARATRARSGSATGAGTSRSRRRTRTRWCDYGEQLPDASAEPAGRRGRASAAPLVLPPRQQQPGQRLRGPARRVVAEVGSGGAASEPSGRPGVGRPGGSSRSTRHSRAQRSVILSASGAFSRLPFSSATAASHASERGASSLTCAGQAISRPPLSLLRTVTRRCRRRARPGSGCSPGPSPTRRPRPRATRATARAGRALAAHPDEAGLLGGLLDEGPVEQRVCHARSLWRAPAVGRQSQPLRFRAAVDAEAERRR